MSFFAIKCNNCGKWGVCEVNDLLNYTFRCKRDGCKGKSSKIKHKHKFGFTNELSPAYDNPEDARNFILSKVPKDSGFFSYKRKL